MRKNYCSLLLASILVLAAGIPDYLWASERQSDNNFDTVNESQEAVAGYKSETETETPYSLFSNEENIIEYNSEQNSVETIEETSPTDIMDYKSFVSKLFSVLKERENSARDLGTATVTGNDPNTHTITSMCQRLALREWEELKDYAEIDFASDLSQSTDDALILREKVKNDYLRGLKMQVDADSNNEETFWTEWEKGFFIRAGAVAEIVDFVSPDIANERELSNSFREAMRSYTGVNEDNKTEVYIVQALLAANNYIEHQQIDGVAGKTTYNELRNFLSSNEGVYCWIINENLIKNMISSGILNEELFKKAVNILSERGFAANVPSEKMNYQYYRENREG